MCRPDRLSQGRFVVERNRAVGRGEQGLGRCLCDAGRGLLAVRRRRHAVADDQYLERQAAPLPAAERERVLVHLVGAAAVAGRRQVGRQGQHRQGGLVVERRAVHLAEPVAGRDLPAAQRAADGLRRG